MFKQSFYLLLAAWVCKNVSAKAPTYSLLPGCEVIFVKNFDELIASHVQILGEQQKCVVFRIEETNTFLIRKNPRWWSFNEPVEELSRTGTQSSPADNSALPAPFGKKILGARRGVAWVEFYYTDFEQRTTEALVPVSVCHSEIYGEGSVVSFQAVSGRSTSLGGKFSFMLSLAGLATSLSADVTLETAKAFSSKVQCEVKEGEVGQLLLQRTRYLYYTPYTRVLVYDAMRKDFSWTERKFKEGTRERSIIKGGVGDWVCASSANIDLKCELVGGLGPFIGVAKEENGLDYNKGEDEGVEHV